MQSKARYPHHAMWATVRLLAGHEEEQSDNILHVHHTITKN